MCKIKQCSIDWSVRLTFTKSISVRWLDEHIESRLAPTTQPIEYTSTSNAADVQYVIGFWSETVWWVATNQHTMCIWCSLVLSKRLNSHTSLVHWPTAEPIVNSFGILRVFTPLVTNRYGIQFTMISGEMRKHSIYFGNGKKCENPTKIGFRFLNKISICKLYFFLIFSLSLTQPLLGLVWLGVRCR